MDQQRRAAEQSSRAAKQSCKKSIIHKWVLLWIWNFLWINLFSSHSSMFFISYIWFWLCSTLLLTQGTVDVFEVVPDVQIEGTSSNLKSCSWFITFIISAVSFFSALLTLFFLVELTESVLRWFSENSRDWVTVYTYFALCGSLLSTLKGLLEKSPWLWFYHNVSYPWYYFVVTIYSRI